MDKFFISFIIPTIGRPTLYNSIESLLLQTDNDWSAFIIFDGVEKNIDIDDNRIQYLEIDKIGNKNYAGYVRNIGFQYCKNSEWIGFLDDDDYLSNDYITKLKQEIQFNPKIDICIFRMKFNNGCILPSKHDKNITRCKVGISFAIKKHISENIFFENNPFEDYFFLKACQNKKYKILISSYVTYFVKSVFSYEQDDLFPKILIN